MSHIFLISKEIHIRPEILDPRYHRCVFCTSDQLCDINPTRSWSQPIMNCYLKELTTGVGRGVGGVVGGFLFSRERFHVK